MSLPLQVALTTGVLADGEVYASTQGTARESFWVKDLHHHAGLVLSVFETVVAQAGFQLRM